MNEPSIDRWRQIIRRLKRTRVAVAGDLIADEFIYGRVERVSREAPVLILQYDADGDRAGRGGQRRQQRGGSRRRGRRDRRRGEGRDRPPAPRGAAAECEDDERLRAGGHTTPVKTRILAGGVHSAKQQVVRIDRAGGRVRPAFAAHVERALARALTRADAVILSDYGSGLVTPEGWRRARAAAGAKARARVLVDSRYALARFDGMTACTPNEPEVEALTGVRIGDDPQALERAGRDLLRRLRCEAVLVTRGSRGMALFERDRPTDHIPIVGHRPDRRRHGRRRHGHRDVRARPGGRRDVRRGRPARQSRRRPRRHEARHRHGHRRGTAPVRF